MTTRSTRIKRTSGRNAKNPFFDTKIDIDRLAEEQGVGIVADFDALLGDFWPDNETIDDFLAARQRWRIEDERA